MCHKVLPSVRRRIAGQGLLCQEMAISLIRASCWPLALTHPQLTSKPGCQASMIFILAAVERRQVKVERIGINDWIWT